MVKLFKRNGEPVLVNGENVLRVETLGMDDLSKIIMTDGSTIVVRGDIISVMNEFVQERFVKNNG